MSETSQAVIPRAAVAAFTATLLLLAALLVTTLLVTIVPAGAQSGGCAGGPFEGATALDSDGDGVSDAIEVQSGTDECDPNSTPALVCGEYVAGYDPANFDADNDGVSDADESAAGTDPCDATSVVAAGTVDNSSPGVVVTTPPPAPTLALTGPSALALTGFMGMLLVALGVASLLIGRRVD